VSSARSMRAGKPRKSSGCGAVPPVRDRGRLFPLPLGNLAFIVASAMCAAAGGFRGLCRCGSCRGFSAVFLILPVFSAIF